MSNTPNKDLVNSLLAKVAEAEAATGSNTQPYTLYSIVFMLLVAFYGSRTRALAQNLPNGKSYDFYKIYVSVLLLASVNFHFNMWGDTLLFNPRGIEKFFNVLMADYKEDMPLEVIATSAVNSMYLRYDLCILIYNAVALICFRLFFMAMLGVFEYICFINNGPFMKLEANEPSFKPVKSVSFDDEIQTLEYAESNASVKTSRIPRIPKSVYLATTRYTIIMVIALVATVMLTPRYILSNTSMVLYRNTDADFIITFDHIHLTVGLVFLIANIHSFISVLNHPEVSNFPTLVYNIACFSWFYNGVILLICYGGVKLINDILFNMLYNMIEEASNTAIFRDNQVSVFTQIFVNYFKHLSDSKCYRAVCSPEESLDAMVETLMFAKDLLSKCATMLNFSCLVIMPMMIWLIVVECKLRKRINEEWARQV